MIIDSQKKSRSTKSHTREDDKLFYQNLSRSRTFSHHVGFKRHRQEEKKFLSLLCKQLMKPFETDLNIGTGDLKGFGS